MMLATQESGSSMPQPIRCNVDEVRPFHSAQNPSSLTPSPTKNNLLSTPPLRPTATGATPEVLCLSMPSSLSAEDAVLDTTTSSSATYDTFPSLRASDHIHFPGFDPPSRMRPLFVSGGTSSTPRRRDGTAGTSITLRGGSPSSVASSSLPPSRLPPPPSMHSATVRSSAPEVPLSCTSSNQTGAPSRQAPTVASLEEEDTCCICLETYTTDNPQCKGSCGHHFHLPCLMGWKQRSNCCPMCCAETLSGIGEAWESKTKKPAAAPTATVDTSNDAAIARQLQSRYVARAARQRIVALPMQTGRLAQDGGQSTRLPRRHLGFAPWSLAGSALEQSSEPEPPATTRPWTGAGEGSRSTIRRSSVEHRGSRDGGCSVM